MRLNRKRVLCIPLFLVAASRARAAERVATSFQDARPVLDARRGQLPPELANANEAKWLAWRRAQDQAIRARLKQGDFDSMVNLLLFGTSFTTQPRIKVENLTADSKSGVLRGRVDDMVAGLRSPGNNERLIFVRGLLRGINIDPASASGSAQAGIFLYNNLQRVMIERLTLVKRGAEARRDSGSPLDRASLFSERGVSLDTSILPDFAIDAALRDLKGRGVLREGSVARVAVVGPGLDFIDKNDESGYDYYPEQTSQPFALYDSLLRLGLAKANALSVTILDISPRVIDHVQRARDRARSGAGYDIQLPRDVARPWPGELIMFWRSLGERAGSAISPIRPPEIFGGLDTRAVRIRADVVLACEPVNLNIVLERLKLNGRDQFDLIAGTNIFVYYDALQQALALENAGSMLKPGGLLLTNDKLPEAPGGAMELAGMTAVKLAEPGGAIGWYRKKKQ